MTNYTIDPGAIAHRLDIGQRAGSADYDTMFDYMDDFSKRLVAAREQYKGNTDSPSFMAVMLAAWSGDLYAEKFIAALEDTSAGGPGITPFTPEQQARWESLQKVMHSK